MEVLDDAEMQAQREDSFGSADSSALGEMLYDVAHGVSSDDLGASSPDRESDKKAKKRKRDE